MKLVLFDCDGTLVDSGGLIHEVMARTFLAFGLDRPEPAATRSIIGLTLDLAIARMLGQAEIDARVADMTRHYKDIYAGVRAEPGFQEPPYEGIVEMIEMLSQRDDLLLGVVTGKSRRGLNLIADTHGFAHLTRDFPHRRRLPLQAASGHGARMLRHGGHRAGRDDRHRRCGL